MWWAPYEQEFVTTSLNKEEETLKSVVSGYSETLVYFYETTKLPSILNDILYLKSDINF
jgi:hypothetical protein